MNQCSTVVSKIALALDGLKFRSQLCPMDKFLLNLFSFKRVFLILKWGDRSTYSGLACRGGVNVHLHDAIT